MFALTVPESAQANPRLTRHRGLERYSSPKIDYRTSSVIAVGALNGAAISAALMPISFSPRPSDGPLNGHANTAQITISLTNLIGRVGGIIKIPGRPAIEVATQLLRAGHNRIVIPRPPGGVPPGSQLQLKVVDSGGASSNVVYDFR